MRTLIKHTASYLRNFFRERHAQYGVVGSTALLLFLFLFFVLPGISGPEDGVKYIAEKYAAASLFVKGTQKILPNDFNEKRIEAIREDEECAFEPEEWDTGSGLLTREEDSLVYTMSPEVYSSTIRYERSISSKSTTKFIFTPESELMNTTIVYHDLFEVVIGDSDHYGISFKANLGGENMETLGERFILRGGIKIGNDVSVIIRQHPLPSGDVYVLLNVAYTAKDGNEYFVAKDWTFKVPSDFVGSEKALRVSIGFLNINNESAISAKFKCFKVSRNNGDRTLSFQKSDEKVNGY